MTTTALKPLTVHCWLREVREDGSLHRVGCVALKRTAKGVMSAFTLCSPGDKFDVKHARRLAVRRLGFPTKVKKLNMVNLIAAVEGSLAFNDVIGLADSVINKHMCWGRVYAEEKNCLTISGAVHNLLEV